MVIVAGLLVIFVSLTAYTIDNGSGRQSEQQAQSAADSAALAAAQVIPPGNTSLSVATVSQMATTLANANDPGADVSVTMPSTTSARVTVSGDSPNGFAQDLGNHNSRVSASAVASSTSTGGSPAAIVTTNPNCDPLDPGIGVGLLSGLHVQGSVIDNAGFGTLLSGGSISGNLTYKQSCWNLNILSYFSVGGTVTASTAPSGTDVQTPLLPLDYSTAYPNPCTSYQTWNWIAPLSTVNLNGVYCSKSPVTLIANQLTGSATIIAPAINVTASGSSLTPYWQGLTLWQTGNSAMSVTLGSLNGGAIFAPTAELNLALSNVTVTGFLEVYTLSVSTLSNLTLIGDGPTIGGTSTVALTQ